MYRHRILFALLTTLVALSGATRREATWAQDRRPADSGGVTSKALETSVATPMLATNLRSTPCKAELDLAVAAFRQGDYDLALERVTQAMGHCPGDPSLHEFRGLVLFAKGDYAEASVVAHKAIAGGSGWTWATIYPFYSDVQTYTRHLRSLESFTKKHPDDGAARFLQAYHYKALGSNDAAVRELEMVIRLEYNDLTAVNLLRTMGRSATSPAPITRTTIGTY